MSERMNKGLPLPKKNLEALDPADIARLRVFVARVGQTNALSAIRIGEATLDNAMHGVRLRSDTRERILAFLAKQGT